MNADDGYDGQAACIIPMRVPPAANWRHIPCVADLLMLRQEAPVAVQDGGSLMTWLSNVTAPFRARLFALRKGVACGAGFKLIEKTPWTQNHGRIDMGENVTIRSLTASARFATQRDATIQIGERTFINSAVAIAAARSVVIGSDCPIADFVTIFDKDFHQIGEGEAPKIAPTRIGRNVWIGRSAIISRERPSAIIP